MEKAECVETSWPVITRTMLADMESLSSRYDEQEVNQGILALVRARKAIGDAMIAVSAAARHFDSKPDVRGQLFAVSTALRAIMVHELPLTVLEHGGNHERPPIFKR